MRFINLKLLALTVILSLAATSVMASNPGKPITCPPASVIAKLTMTKTELYKDFWIPQTTTKFAGRTWFVGVLVPANHAVDSQDSINKGNAAITSAKKWGNGRVLNLPGSVYSACLYDTNSQYIVAAGGSLH